MFWALHLERTRAAARMEPEVSMLTAEATPASDTNYANTTWATPRAGDIHVTSHTEVA
jgi:hypothetical protein